MTTDSKAPLLGYGVLWNRSRAATWSHTPLALHEGLRGTGPLVDLGYDSKVRRWIHLLSHLRLSDGRPHSTWRSSPRVLEAARRSLERAARTHQVDAILTIGDLGVFDRPFFVFQDLSYDLLEREIGQGNSHAEAQFGRLSAAERDGLRHRQHAIFDQVAGVLAMSDWYARSLVEDSGLDPAKVHVVHPGATAAGATPVEPDRRSPNALFVGRDFDRKGGPLVVDAVRSIREDGLDLGLTIIGPSVWPLDGEPPEWVDFRGPQPVDVVAHAMASHQVFVLPTRFEAFGIVFAEALRAGTPAVGPDAFAVPEIIRDGVDGALFSGWTVPEVSASIERALSPTVREQAFDGATACETRFSWERAATEVRSAISSGWSLSGADPA